MRAIDADAFAEFLKDAIKQQKYEDTKIDGLLTVADVIEAVISELDGTSLEGFKNTPTIEPEPPWIPCSERLPEEYGNYLATMDDGDVQECTYSPEKNTPFMRGGWSTCEADEIVFLDIAEVIAWMPLPEPYQEGAD